MRTRLSTTSALALTVSLSFSLLVDASEARACGGGFGGEGVDVGMEAQLALYALYGDRTELVVLVNVPDATNDFGVLLPVPAGTTISPSPVDAAGLADLEQQTRPDIVITEGDDDDGGGLFGCGSRGYANGGDGEGEGVGGVAVSEPVDIGPITAVVLTGTNGAAIGDWLASNGFVVPEGAEAIVDSYQNAGSHFVAMKRNETSSGAASLGVRMTIPGDHRGFALRMASVGAADELAITLFVLHDEETYGPSAPFTVLHLNDLDPGAIVDEGYRAAVRAAVDAHDGRAFVAEADGAFQNYEGFGLQDVVNDGMRYARFTTVMAGVDLGEDVALDAVIEMGSGELEIDRSTLEASAHPLARLSRIVRTGGDALPIALLALVLLVVRARRSRAPTSPPATPARARARRRRHAMRVPLRRRARRRIVVSPSTRRARARVAARR